MNGRKHVITVTGLSEYGYVTKDNKVAEPLVSSMMISTSHLRPILSYPAICCKHVPISRAIAWQLLSHLAHIARASSRAGRISAQKVHIMQPFERYKKPPSNANKLMNLGPYDLCR
jgi:hypothetical protein